MSIHDAERIAANPVGYKPETVAEAYRVTAKWARIRRNRARKARA